MPRQIVHLRDDGGDEAKGCEAGAGPGPGPGLGEGLQVTNHGIGAGWQGIETPCVTPVGERIPLGDVGVPGVLASGQSCLQDLSSAAATSRRFRRDRGLMGGTLWSLEGVMGSLLATLAPF